MSQFQLNQLVFKQVSNRLISNGVPLVSTISQLNFQFVSNGCQSLSNGCQLVSNGVPMEVNHSPMEFQWNSICFQWMSIGLQWSSNGVPMEFQWKSIGLQGVPMEVHQSPMEFNQFPMEFPLYIPGFESILYNPAVHGILSISCKYLMVSQVILHELDILFLL